MASTTATYPRFPQSHIPADGPQRAPFESRAAADGQWVPCCAWRVLSPWVTSDDPEGRGAQRHYSFSARSPFEAIEAYDRMRAELPARGLRPATGVIPDAGAYTEQVRTADGALSAEQVERLASLGWIATTEPAQRHGGGATEWRTIRH